MINVKHLLLRGAICGLALAVLPSTSSAQERDRASQADRNFDRRQGDRDRDFDGRRDRDRDDRYTGRGGRGDFRRNHRDYWGGYWQWYDHDYRPYYSHRYYRSPYYGYGYGYYPYYPYEYRYYPYYRYYDGYYPQARLRIGPFSFGWY